MKLIIAKSTPTSPTLFLWSNHLNALSNNIYGYFFVETLHLYLHANLHIRE